MCRRSSTPAALARVRRALVCHGARDEWYTRSDLRARRPTAARGGRDRSAAGVRRRPRMVRRGRAGGVLVSSTSGWHDRDSTAPTSADAERLAELRWEFRAGAAAADRAARRVRQALRGVDAPRARSDRRVAGLGRRRRPRHRRAGVAAHRSEDSESDRGAEQHAYLSNLYVKPSDRGRDRHAAARGGARLAPREPRRSRRALAVRRAA